MLSPLFIVGSPRSGTSILVQAMQRTGYAGYREGNFLSLLQTLNASVDRHFSDFGTTDPDVLVSHIDKTGLKAGLAGILREAVEALAPKDQPWLDKTGNPEMIAAIPTIRALWPNAVFIFAKRRGIENIASRLQKFPQLDFTYHCKDWARNMATWRQLRESTPSLPFLEIDQWDIASQPDETADIIGHFLELSADDAAAIAKEFHSARPQETAPGTATRILTLAETGWTTAQQEIFQRFCGQAMAENDYVLDATYRSLALRDALRWHKPAA